MVGDLNGNVTALRLSDGAVLWSRAVPGMPISAPIFTDGSLIFYGRNAAAHQAENGAYRSNWIQLRGAHIRARPLHCCPVLSGMAASSGLVFRGGPSPGNRRNDDERICALVLPEQ